MNGKLVMKNIYVVLGRERFRKEVTTTETKMKHYDSLFQCVHAVFCRKWGTIEYFMYSKQEQQYGSIKETKVTDFFKFIVRSSGLHIRCSCFILQMCTFVTVNFRFVFLYARLYLKAVNCFDAYSLVYYFRILKGSQQFWINEDPLHITIPSTYYNISAKHFFLPRTIKELRAIPFNKIFS